MGTSPSPCGAEACPGRRRYVARVGRPPLKGDCASLEELISRDASKLYVDDMLPENEAKKAVR